MKKEHVINGFLLVLVIGTFIWSAISPYERGIWFLEVGPTTLLLLLLIRTYRKFQFSTLSYCIFAFVIILTYIGGHYTFNDMPLFNWIRDRYQLDRNYYDRFGHLMKGLVVVPTAEFIYRKGWIKQKWFIYIVSFSLILSLASLYEIVEWIASMIAGKSSKDFLGTQGDIWDSQWDMALAAIGAILSSIMFRNNIEKRKKHSD